MKSTLIIYLTQCLQHRISTCNQYFKNSTEIVDIPFPLTDFKTPCVSLAQSALPLQELSRRQGWCSARTPAQAFVWMCLPGRKGPP